MKTIKRRKNTIARNEALRELANLKAIKRQVKRSIKAKRGAKRNPSPRASIELVGALVKEGAVWTAAPPRYAANYRGGPSGSGLKGIDPAHVPVVVGMILDKEGKRVAHRIVRLQLPGKAFPIVTRTDETGRFRFPEVAPGEYLLRSGQMSRKIVVVDPRTMVIQ